MKATINICIVSLLALILTACNSKENQIVGQWNSNQTITQDEGTIKLKGTINFKSDGTCSSKANATVTSNQTVEGYMMRITIHLSMSSNEDWTLNGDELVFSPKSVNIKLNSVKYYDPDTGALVLSLTGNALREAESEMIPEMKQDMMQASTERILMMQDNKIVTEEITDEGKKITCTYNRAGN